VYPWTSISKQFQFHIFGYQQATSTAASLFQINQNNNKQNMPKFKAWAFHRYTWNKFTPS